MASMRLIGVLPVTENRTGISGKIKYLMKGKFLPLRKSAYSNGGSLSISATEVLPCIRLIIAKFTYLVSMTSKKVKDISKLKLQGTRVFCTVFSLYMFDFFKKIFLWWCYISYRKNNQCHGL